MRIPSLVICHDAPGVAAFNLSTSRLAVVAAAQGRGGGANPEISRLANKKPLLRRRGRNSNAERESSSSRISAGIGTLVLVLWSGGLVVTWSATT
jgi:hypothetical protein